MNPETEAVLARILRKIQTSSLGTLHDGAPMVSMVPFLAADDFSAFYIHISQLALHTQNLLVDPRASILITESGDSDVDPQTFARVSIQGRAKTLKLQSEQYAETQSKYLEKYPQAEINFQLGDFLLVAIQPSAGRFVAGFGQIHDLALEEFIRASHSGA